MNNTFLTDENMKYFFTDPFTKKEVIDSPN